VPKILSEGKGTIEFHPKFSPDGKSIFVLFKDVDNLNDLIVYREGKNPITLLSGAEEIYYNFTYEGDSAVVYYKTTHKNEGEIFLLDLDIMSRSKISDGDNPYITNLFSIDGKPWE
jgi:Tol biopolymer transport system component